LLLDLCKLNDADQCSGAKSDGKGKPRTPTPNGLAQDISSLSLQDTPKVKSKNLNVVEEFAKAKMKDAVSFVVVGHVDHGKSTLMGRLLYDLRVVDEKTVEKLRRDSKKIGKASFALAWVMDATSDERERLRIRPGLTNPRANGAPTPVMSEAQRRRGGKPSSRLAGRF